MPYRSDDEASKVRREALERELAEVKARSTEYAYLQWRAKEIEKELEELTKRESAFAQKKRLPMLANAKIASPCNADWNDMRGDTQVRFCGKCEKNVYNLSEMTEDEAEALILEKEGKLCARFYTRADGTVMTKDCSVGVRRKWATRAGAAAVLLGGGAAALAAFAPKTQCHTMGDLAVNTSEPAVMGSIAAPEAPPPTSVTPKQPEMGTVTPHHPPAMMGKVSAVPTGHKK
ncbi:MAG TPA: hypothetical protein VF407_14790 [Polyangiaceae bacterium]